MGASAEPPQHLLGMRILWTEEESGSRASLLSARASVQLEPVTSISNLQPLTWKPVKGAAGLDSSKCTTAPACCRPATWAGLISIFAWMFVS